MNPDSAPTHSSELAAVDEAMAGLRGLEAAPTSAHVALYEWVHGALTDALSAIDGV